MNLTVGELIKELESLSTIVGGNAPTNVSSVGSEAAVFEDWGNNRSYSYPDKPKRAVSRGVWVEQVITDRAEPERMPEFTNLVNE